MILSDKENLMLINLESMVRDVANPQISRKRFELLNKGQAQPTPDEIDLISDYLVDNYKYTENDVYNFLLDWTPKNVDNNVINSVNDEIQEKKIQEENISKENDNDEIFSGWFDDGPTNSINDNKENKNSEKFQKLLDTIETHSDNLRLVEIYQQMKNSGSPEQIKLVQEKCILINKRLVLQQVSKYANMTKSSAMTVADLYVLGVMGLLKALDKFEFDKDTEFSTYAVIWIKQHLFRGIYNEADMIRIPVHYHEALSKFNRVKRDLIEQNGTVTIDEVAKALKITVKKAEEYAFTDYAFNNITSVDAKIGGKDGESNSNLADIAPLKSIFSSELIDPEVRLMANEDAGILVEELNNVLKERDAYIMALRYGLIDGEEHTLEYVGNKIGVTRERVRQIEAKSLRKLRNIADHNKKLYPYNIEKVEKDNEKEHIH